VASERRGRYRDYLRLAGWAAFRPGIFPWRNIGETTWLEVTDPADFVVQSLLLLYYLREDGEVWGPLTPAIWVMRRVYMLIGLVGVAASLAVPILLSPGDPVAFSVTLLALGFLTLIPGQVATIRKRLHIKQGEEYPMPLRRAMWLCESLALLAAAAVLLCAHPDATHQGILWGVFAVSLSELATFYALVNSSIATNLLDANEPLRRVACRIAEYKRSERARTTKD
jgi:hypothetical protein